MIENSRAELKEVWSSFSEIIHDRFGLEVKMDSDTALDWAHQLLSSTMDGVAGKLNEEGSLDYLLRGLIASVCLRSALKTDCLCNECINDLSNEFARQMLASHEKEKWRTWWSKVSPRTEVSSVFIYNPSLTFPKLEELAGSEAFDTLVREILIMSKYGINLDFDGYLQYLRTRLHRFSTKLDMTELKIISSLLNNPNITNESLAHFVKISPEWVSRKITNLRKRAVLRRFDRVPFSKIGIRMFHFLVDSFNSDEDPYRLLSACPFLYSYRNVLTGRWNGLGFLCVPDNLDNIRSLSLGEKLLGKWGIRTLLREIASLGTINCFDYYDLNSNDWSIPWELLEIQLNRIHNEGLAKVIKRIDTPANRTKFHLDDLDMKILDQCRKGSSSISRIRKSLKVGQERVARKIKALREEQLLVTTWEVHNIGLHEGVIVINNEQKSGEAIAAWAQRLPRIIVTFDTDRKLFLTTQLPIGGSYGLSSSLRSLSKTTTIGILDTNIYGAWGLPIDLWDSKKQNWRCPRDAIENWFSYLR
jgi:DNA-binding Lrp family transcriptional regulator